MALGNPAPLGLIAFGMTTAFLMYVEVGWAEADFEVSIAGTALTLGGAGQVLVGIFELIKGSSFSFAVFCCYGFFWLGFAVTYTEKGRSTSNFGDAEYRTGQTLYFAQWGVLTLCFWIISLRKNNALIVVFTGLWITFFLLAAAQGSENDNVKTAAGYFGLMTAAAAFYTGIAELVNEEWGYHALPGLRPIVNPQRTTITPGSIAALIHYHEPSNTMMLQFRGLQITTMADVNVIKEAVESSIKENVARSHKDKVHMVVDYQDTVISENAISDYWQMTSSLESRYYLSCSRYHVSSFGTKHPSPTTGDPPPAVGLKKLPVTAEGIAE